jgi:hypothetical protein
MARRMYHRTGSAGPPTGRFLYRNFGTRTTLEATFQLEVVSEAARQLRWADALLWND